jgi:hypothetical protein
VSCAQCLLVRTAGLSRGGFILKRGNKPGAEEEFGYIPSSSVTLERRACHR